jgi:drug/metabolite transporter (DMT)-like permease
MQLSPLSSREKDAEAGTRLLVNAEDENTFDEKSRASGGEALVPCTTQIFWLVVWMANNILVTITNKASFAKVNFNYPFALSTIHMAFNIVGAQIFFKFSKIKPKVIEGSKNLRSIMIFSVIFALNIAVGNASLSYVSVSFNQVCRSMVPVVVMGMSIIYFGKSYSNIRKLSILPIVCGVALAVWGDMSYTVIGAFSTFVCVILAALKSVSAGELLTGDLKLHEMDLLSKMCPYALVQIAFLGCIKGEFQDIYENFDTIFNDTTTPRVIALSALLSFTLNASSFVANKVTSPLTLSIGANVKQVLLILMASAYFGDSIGLLHGTGIGIVVMGSFGYGYADKNRL